MAADLVRRQVNVLVAVGGEPSALAVKRATSTIPIVFGIGDDAVELVREESLGNEMCQYGPQLLRHFKG
jgi:ABC-type uncharacterized transport system substrate-binding protein